MAKVDLKAVEKAQIQYAPDEVLRLPIFEELPFEKTDSGGGRLPRRSIVLVISAAAAATSIIIYIIIYFGLTGSQPFQVTSREFMPIREAIEDATAELQQERKKTAALTNELTAARRDYLATIAAISNKAGDETAQLQKTAEAATAELQQERKKTAALTNDLATARRDLETKAALSSKAGDETARLQKTAEAATAELQQERKKTAALTNDLATARRDLETKATLSSKAGDETAQLQKTAEAATAALQQERKKTTALAAIEPTKTPDSIAGVETKPNTVAPVSAQPATLASKADSEAARLMARAQSLLSQGDINGARIVLERAVEMGSAKASFAIAETYDPRVLSHWNVYGTRGNAAKAGEFYAKAAAGGIEEAKGRLDSLH